MIVIDKMITHILDASSNIIVCSDLCMEGSDEQCLRMLEQKISKAFASTQRKNGTFKEGSPIAHMIEEYRASLISFEEMSQQMAKLIFQAKIKYAQFEASDLMIAEVVFEERRYVVAIDHAYLEGLTHHTSQQGELIQNEILTNQILLSSSFIKRDRAFMVEFSDNTVSSVEAKVDIESEKKYFYGDIVLACNNTPSYKDSLSSIHKACEQVVEQFDLKEVEVIPKMKQIIKENVEAKSDIDVEEVATILFADQPQIKSAFQEEVVKRGVEKPIQVENMKSSKAEKVQKIRTDKGIEIIIPVDFMNSTDYVEFHNLPDGTISIQLKNINRIISK